MSSNPSDTVSSSRAPTPDNRSHAESTPNTTPDEFDVQSHSHIFEDNDIAVVGMGCRTPGGINSTSQLWEFLLRKGDASGNIPAMRWEPYLRRDTRNAEVLSRTTAKGYFLDDLEAFDAEFFNISRREAEQMDPQQRIALEVTWEALEHAGIPPQNLAGSNTAVYMGVNSDDYSRLLLEDLPNVEAWCGVGTAFCGIPNRISYVLDLMGPSSAIDAACASSLVAIHHARQALISRETDLAIAGGVNALIGPGLTRVLDQAGAIAADGRCRSFDDSACGYGRGEGAGVVILKRLTTALLDGDHIHAVLKGSAVGADGRTNGIMAPNGFAQENVARKALQEAKFDASSISYVEAHATSTPIGDPCETTALANIYGSGARSHTSDPCLIGSIKSNIGHLEAGAGVLGFIKAVMVLQNGLVPPQANLTTPNTKIDWANNKLLTCQTATKLAPLYGTKRAAIASYGYGGTVSHAVIEASPSPRRSLRIASTETLPEILFLSAPQANRLSDAATALASWLENEGAQADLHSVAATLATRRGHHKFRSAIVAESTFDAIKLLKKAFDAASDPCIMTGRLLPSYTKGAVWIFSGHGAQWKDMGKSLLQTRPAFLNVVQQLEPIIQNETGFSALDALSNGDFESSDKVQVLTFVMHIGIAALLREAGATPQAIIGHSVGEIAAAVVAGVLTLREGALIVCRRAVLLRKLMGQGAMILVDLSYEEVSTEIQDIEGINAAIDVSPSSAVVSGTIVGIQQITQKLNDRNIQVRKVQSDIAFHSDSLSMLASPLREVLCGQLAPTTPEIPLYSTSLQDPRSQVPRDEQYWIDNMIKPVLLRSTISAAVEDGYKVFLEVSSHPIITHSINETLLDAGVEDAVALPTMLRNKAAESTILRAIGKLHCLGDSIDFSRFDSHQWLEEVPTTVWKHQSYWRSVGGSPALAQETHNALSHNLLGGRTSIWGSDGMLWQTVLDETSKPFPGKHPLHGSEIVPAAVLLNTFLKASSSRSLHDVSLRVPVVVSPPQEVQIFYQDNQIRITSRLARTEGSNTSEESWLVNTTSRVGADEATLSAASIDIRATKKRLDRQLSPDFSIEYLASVGVPEMGFPWKVLDHHEIDGEMLAMVDGHPNETEALGSKEGSWAPIFDAATSIASTIFYKSPRLRMPTAIKRVVLRAGCCSPKVGYVYVKQISSDAADVFVCSLNGDILAEFQAMAFAGIEGETFSRKSTAGLVHRIAWPPAQLAEEPLHFKHVLLLSDGSPSITDTYEKQLRGSSYTTRVVQDLESPDSIPSDSVVVYVPCEGTSAEDAFKCSSRSCERLLTATKTLIDKSPRTKIFCITQNSKTTDRWTILSQATLHGLARIIQSEHAEIWGALIEVEDAQFPMQAIKYVHGADVVKIQDTVARNARLRPFPTEPSGAQLNRITSTSLLPQGTYLITGGLGSLGLKVAMWMAEKGARRILLVSRRKLPPRREWAKDQENQTYQTMLALEAMGVTVSVVVVDMSDSAAASHLQHALDELSFPPITGVVHAAGVLKDELVTQTTSTNFNTVLAPKLVGAMALHELFPPQTLDFFVMFSSCGQLLGFPGQASYAASNSFLDALASYRHNLGDNCMSLLWTSWRGLGMAASTEYINAELNARGITDITPPEAFMAWEKAMALGTDHAVVLRTLELDADEPSPHPILNDIITRRRPTVGAASDSETSTKETAGAPKSGPELKEWLTHIITSCVATTMGTAESSIDVRTALSEMGMDSVMTVLFRSELQGKLKVKVAPTLIWKCPTIQHLVKHFMEVMEEKS